MNLVMLIIVALSVVLCGCNREPEWVSENVQHSLDTVSSWLSYAKLNGGSEFLEFSRDDFSNKVHYALTTAIDTDDQVFALRFPLCLEISRRKMTDFDLRILNGRMHDWLSRNCTCKYEIHMLMLDTEQRWLQDRIYFVEDVGDEVNVTVLDVDELNEWSYSGGSSALVALNNRIVDCTGEKIGVFRVCIRNIIDDALRGCESEELALFLRKVGDGSASVFWETDPRPLSCGTHRYNHKEFYEWVMRRDCTYMLELAVASEREWVLIPRVFVKSGSSEFTAL